MLEVGYLARTLGWDFRGVRSPFWRLHHNDQPGGSIRSGGRRHPLAPGQAVLTPPFVGFDCSAPDGVPHFWIHFAVEPAIISHRQPLTILLTRADRMLLAECVAGVKRGRAMAGLRARCEALVRIALGVAGPGDPPDLPLERVLDRVHRGFAGPCPNTELARLAGRSTGAFIRWFKERTGLTPHEYLNRRRLREACRRLRFTDESIEAIAESCGFPNRHYFTRIFSAGMGLGPAAFRAQPDPATHGASI